MISAIAIPDPTAALMLAGVDLDGRTTDRARRAALRRRQRRFQQQSRLRRLLA